MGLKGDGGVERVEAKRLRSQTSTIAEYIAQLNYGDIPHEVVEVTKRCILDTLGVLLAGSGVGTGIEKLVELIAEGGGTSESSIVGFGLRVPAWMAALANGAMAHVQDYDDYDRAHCVHPSATTVPGACAVLERKRTISGRELITAITVGNDFIIRLARAVPAKRMWHKTTTLGVFSCAATCSKLLGLGRQETVDALGIAFCQSAGTRELRFGVGSDVGGMYNGFPSMAGTLAALMAEKGITGIKDSLGGVAGLINAYFDGEYDPMVLTGELGERFENVNIGFKPWPSCDNTHSYIEAALELVHRHNIVPQDVARVYAYVNDVTGKLCEPIEARRNPMTITDAKYSIPFVLAVAIARRRVSLEDFSGDSISDAEVLRLAQKVTPRMYSEPPFGSSEAGPPPGEIEIHLKGGRVFRRRVDLAYGNPTRAMSTEDLLKKFRECAGYAVTPLPEENVERVVEIVGALEEVDDVSVIMQMLAGRS